MALISKEDDGTLAFLNIPRNKASRSFNCDTTTQQKLVNTQFYVCDFLEDVPTRFTKQKGTAGQTLVLIKKKHDTPDSEAQKFFTGSQDIIYVLDKLREMDAFPRLVTMRCNNNRYFFE